MASYTVEPASTDPVQREIDKQKGLKRPKAAPQGEAIDPAVEELAKQDFAQSNKDEPLSYRMPGETVVSSPSKPSFTVESTTDSPKYEVTPASGEIGSTNTSGKPKSDLLGGINKTYQSYRPTPEMGMTDVPSDPLAIPGYMMSEAFKGGKYLLGEATAPLATARDYTFGAMTGKPGEPVSPREVGDIFNPPGGPSTDWKQNIIPGTIEGLAELAIPLLGKGYISGKVTGRGGLEAPPLQSPRAGQRLLGEEQPDVLTPDAILKKGQQPPRPTVDVNAPIPKMKAGPAQPNQPVSESVGLKPEEEPRVGEFPVAETGPKWKRWWDKEKFKWGQELPVIRETPGSPVISSMEGHHVWTEGQLEDLLKEPWSQTILHKYNGQQWKTLEDDAVRIWKNGGKTEKSYQQAIKEMPQEFQDMLARRDLNYAVENEIRTRRGLDPIPYVHEPYFPRITESEWKEFRSVYSGGGMGMGGGAKTTVKGHQQSRYYGTYGEGESAGVRYKDPRAGWLSREMSGLQLRSTDQMITGLEEAGVLHKTKSAAEAASPTGKVQHITGIPFGPERGGWWVRTEEEAQFLRQNLTPPKMGDWTRLANTWLRTPSLINPYPHLLKNMMYKYGLETFVSKGKMRNLIPDIHEWKMRSDPATMARFEQVMPFSESGKNAFEIMNSELPKGPMEQVETGLSMMNKYSQAKIFRDWDPALRYAKWREYVRQGMSDQEAANHTWVDLIRYGTRSDRIDAWKALPMNFFVPWRVGAIRTLKKAMDTDIVRTMAFVGAIDVLREIDSRTNDRWVHMPQDYLERPLMEMAHGKGVGAARTALITAIAGPGGEFFIRSLETVLKNMELKGEWKDVKNLYWGLAQVYDLVPEYQAAERDGQWAKHMVNMTTLMLLGRHATPYGPPPRFGELIPESVIPLSPEAQASKNKGEIARGEKPKPGGLGGGLGGGLMK